MASRTPATTKASHAERHYGHAVVLPASAVLATPTASQLLAANPDTQTPQEPAMNPKIPQQSLLTTLAAIKTQACTATSALRTDLAVGHPDSAVPATRTALLLLAASLTSRTPKALATSPLMAKPLLLIIHAESNLARRMVIVARNRCVAALSCMLICRILSLLLPLPLPSSNQHRSRGKTKSSGNLKC